MRGELDPGEPHPAAFAAQKWLADRPRAVSIYYEALCSTAISGNRSAEIQAETLRRLLAGEPVSDRYLLGVAFNMAQSGCDELKLEIDD